jgi:ribonuclease HII
MLVAGLDEAGRGCVLGPLVVAGLVIKEENLPSLAALGVKDSKLLTAKRRESLTPEILALSERCSILKLPPAEIDRYVKSQRKLHKLNCLEAETMAKIISDLKPDIAFIDAADVVAKRFGKQILELSSFKTQVVSEHKADKTYPIVSAASILAKVERDKTVSALRQEFGDFGTGYLTDPKTSIFLKDWLRTHCEFPECVRKSWKPARKAKADQGTEQQRLL